MPGQYKIDLKKEPPQSNCQPGMYLNPYEGGAGQNGKPVVIAKVT